MRTLTTTEAEELAARRDFQWWQVFELAPGVLAPGVNFIELLIERAQVPLDLTGASVLDIGTTNGGAAFTAERRGADRIVAVDIFEPTQFGVATLCEIFESKVEFVRSSIYDLPSHPKIAGEQFDFVFFFGVLYHLRHPILALDNVRQLTRGQAYLETAVSDNVLPGGLPTVAQFHRGVGLNEDGSNWFTPSVSCLMDWVRSCGFDATIAALEPQNLPHRAQVNMTPTAGEPEWLTLSYERPLRVQVDWDE